MGTSGHSSATSMSDGSALIDASEKISSMHDWVELQARRVQTIANLFVLQDGGFIEYDNKPAPQIMKRPIPRTCGVMNDLS